MTWFDRPDDEVRCEASIARLIGSELVARFLTNKNSVPEDMIFKRDQITQGKNPISNACGQSSGLSIDQCTDLTNEEIRTRARQYAEIVEGRISQGALVACVQALRDIRIPGINGPVVKVYDDGSIENVRHAVLRATDQIDRP